MSKLFHIGQLIPVRVVELVDNDKGVHVECTINPREIFEGISHVWFQKGMLIWCSVQSVLDHGYEINIGVKNCRVFLPSKNIDEGRDFSKNLIEQTKYNKIVIILICSNW